MLLFANALGPISAVVDFLGVNVFVPACVATCASSGGVVSAYFSTLVNPGMLVSASLTARAFSSEEVAAVFFVIYGVGPCRVVVCRRLTDCRVGHEVVWESVVPTRDPACGGILVDFVLLICVRCNVALRAVIDQGTIS